MADEDSAEKSAHFWYMLPRDLTQNYVSVQLKYRDCTVAAKLEDSDEGWEDLRDLLKVVPKVAKSAREERSIQKAMAEVDNDLNELFEDDE